MADYSNLVSNSALVSEIIELLHASGNRASVQFIAETVLRLPDADTELAALIIQDLIQDDVRLRVSDNETVELISAQDSQTRPLRDTDFVVVDVETTGAKTPPHRIMEIGAYRISNHRIVAEFQTLVNPQTSIPPFIVQLTGINDEMVKDAPLFAEVAAEWLNFAGDAVLVAHNAPFDVRFLDYELARIFPNRRMANSNLCTVRLARRLVPGLVNYRLHTLAEHFCIPIINRHRAAGDARATAEIFLHLLASLHAHGISDVAAARHLRLQSAATRALVNHS